METYQINKYKGTAVKLIENNKSAGPVLQALMNLWTHTTIFHNSINHADKNAHREARYRNKRNKLLSNLSAWVTLISDEYVIGLPPAVKTETTELVMVSWTYNLVSYPSSTISLHADVMDSIQQIKNYEKQKH